MYANIDSYLDSVFPDPTNKTLFLTELARSLRCLEHERKVLVFKGSGANGKSVLMRIICIMVLIENPIVEKDSDSRVRLLFTQIRIFEQIFLVFAQLNLLKYLDLDRQILTLKI